MTEIVHSIVWLHRCLLCALLSTQACEMPPPDARHPIEKTDPFSGLVYHHREMERKLDRLQTTVDQLQHTLDSLATQDGGP